MTPQPDVMVVGRSCVDYIAVVKSLPPEDAKAPLEFRMTEGGGQGGTASSCISRLGGRATYVGRLGEDMEGRFCLQRLKEFGVDTTFVQMVENGKTPVAYIFVTESTGKRTIIYERNSLPRFQIEDLLPALSLHPKVLLLDPETTYLASIFKSENIEETQIVYDCERWREGMEAMMTAADYFIPAASFLDEPPLSLKPSGFFKKMRFVKSRVKGELIVTSGAQGAYYFSEDSLFHVLPPRIAVKDTTGAGDNFHAAFAHAVAKEWDLHEAVRFSVAVASLSCREYGGRKGIPEEKEASHVAAGLKSRRL